MSTLKRGCAAAVLFFATSLVALTVTEPPAARGVLATAYGAPISWVPCGSPDGVECARIRVPLDWDHPKGRKITLALARHLAGKPEQRIGSLLINPGGPGDTGVGLVRGDPDGLDALGDGRFDVVSWDPRGTNSSTRTRCFRSRGAEKKFWAGASIPASGAASRRFRPKVASLARRCGKVSGWLLPHISTADTARDLDHLRALLGEERLTYVGLSYGTYLGQTYANMFPGRVRAMVLDGVVDQVAYAKGAEARTISGVAPVDGVFDSFLSLCETAGPERCALAGGSRSPVERVDRLVARLKRNSIPAPGARPASLSPDRFSYGDLLLSQLAPLRGPDLWPQNARDLRAAIGGNGSALETAARGFLTPTGWAAATTSAAIQCADAPARRSLRSWPRVIGRLKGISRIQGQVQGWWLWAPCASWPVRGQDSYRGPWGAKTPNPIMLIGTRHDPNTGYRNAVLAERRLGNAVLLTHEGYGHISFRDPSSCVEKAEADYLVNLVTPPKGTVCQADQKPFGMGSG